jgi:hypothetical protein
MATAVTSRPRAHVMKPRLPEALNLFCIVS